ncbi:MAG: radical SAM protein [Sedimenticola sp.]
MQLRIGWFGGEPLLAREVVCRVSAHAMAEAGKRGGLLFESGMSTNGYLLDVKAAERLISCGVTDYQITLDGPEAIHDLRRLRKDGKGTFSRIWSNLLALKQSALEFRVNLRVHLSQASVPVLEKFITHLSQAFSGDQRFRLFLKTIERLGGGRDEAIDVIGSVRGQELESRLAEIAVDNHMSLLQVDDGYICYAARPSSFVVRHNGDLVKCTVGLDDPLNQVGRLLPDGQLDIDQRRIRPWLEGAVSLDRERLGCPRSRLAL